MTNRPSGSACAKILAEKGPYRERRRTALAGLEKAKGEKFDLALIDLKMPQMDGMELLENLNELDPT